MFAHHPLYTKGAYHGTLGRCLRDHVYDASPSCKGTDQPRPGMMGRHASLLGLFARVCYLHEFSVQFAVSSPAVVHRAVY